MLGWDRAQISNWNIGCEVRDEDAVCGKGFNQRTYFRNFFLVGICVTSQELTSKRKPGIMVCNPGAGKAETGGPLGLTGQLA